MGNYIRFDWMIKRLLRNKSENKEKIYRSSERPRIGFFSTYGFRCIKNYCRLYENRRGIQNYTESFFY